MNIVSSVIVIIITLAIIAVVYGIIKFVCTQAYQYASGVVEEYYDAIIEEGENKEPTNEVDFITQDWIENAKEEFNTLMKSKKPFIWLARKMYF